MKIKKGEKWYVQFHKKGTLLPMEICDVTRETVLLSKLLTIIYDIPARYIIKDVKFVEKINESQEM